MGAPFPRKKPPLWKRRFYVHKIQRTYAIWFGLFMFFSSLLVFSMFVTHRLAGPLFRLEQTARELIRGNLALRIRLRKGDELHELAGLLNEVLDTLEQAFRGIRESEAHAREVLSWIMDEMRRQPSVNREVLNRLEIALKEGERIDEILKRFQISEPS